MEQQRGLKLGQKLEWQKGRLLSVRKQKEKRQRQRKIIFRPVKPIDSCRAPALGPGRPEDLPEPISVRVRGMTFWVKAGDYSQHPE